MDNLDKKYKITDPEGSQLFLDAVKVIPDDGGAKAKAIEAAIIKKRKRNIIIIAGSVVGVMIIMSVVMFNLVQSTRNKELKINSALHSAQLFESNMKSGNSRISNFQESMKEADSLLNIIELLIKKYPDEDTLKFAWVDVLLHKYEKFIHYSLKSNMFDKIAQLDTNLLNTAKKYRPEMADIIPLFKSIPEFYRYKRLYSEPPVLATLVPQKWAIQDLIEKSQIIEKTMEERATLIEVHFPVLYSWISYAANYVIPEIYDWQDFWTKFDIAVKPESSKITSETIFNELKKSYPNVEVLKSNLSYDFDQMQEFTIGLCEKSISPPGKSLAAEWYPWIEYLRNNYGLVLSIKIFENYSELYSAIQNQTVDFAILDMPTSTVSYFADAGTPVAVRVWKNEIYVNNFIFTSQPNITDAGQLKEGFVGFFANDYYELLRFFDKNNIKVDYSKYAFKRYVSLDSLLKSIERNEINILTVSQEEAYYIGAQNLTKAGFKIVGQTGNSPLGILWARKGLPPEFVTRVQGIMIPLPASTVYKSGNAMTDFPYSDWEIYSPISMNRYIQETKQVMLKYNTLINSMHLLPIKIDSDSMSFEISKNLEDYLHKEGFMVVNHNNDLKPIKIADNEQYMTLKSAQKDDKHQIELNIYKKKKQDSTLLYHDNFEISKNEMPPDFKHLLFDLPNYITYYLKVYQVFPDKIIISVDTDPKKFLGKSIKFYKSDNLGRKTDVIGVGKINSISGVKLIVNVSSVLSKKIKPGDIGEINYE